MQSSGPSTIAPRVAANSWTKAAEDVPRPAAWNSITWRASHERIYTQWTQSASFAAAITCTRPSSCTVGPTWSGCAGTSGRRGPPLQGTRRFRQSRPLLAPGRAHSGRYSERGPRRPSLHAPRARSRAHGSENADPADRAPRGKVELPGRKVKLDHPRWSDCSCDESRRGERVEQTGKRVREPL